MLVLALGVVSLAHSRISFAQASNAFQTEYIRITATTADIHAAPTESSEVVVRAREGEIYSIVGTQGEWYTVRVFTWAPRYLLQSLAEKTDKPVLRETLETRKNICLELGDAQRRAREATDEYEEREGATIDEAVSHNNLLRDREELPIFRRYGIAPALQQDLDCYDLLYRTANVLSVISFVFSVTAPFVVIGMLSAGVITWRGARANADGAHPYRRTMLLSILIGTLISAVLITIGALLISAAIVPLGGGGGIIFVIVGVLGVLVVGSYVVVARNMSLS